MKLTQSQARYVDQLFDSSYQIISDILSWNSSQTNLIGLDLYGEIQSNQKTIYFEAPTGAGKTFMVFHWIDRILKLFKLLQKPVVIVFVTISDTELPGEINRKFQQYSQMTGSYFLVKHIKAWSKTKSRTEDDREISFNAGQVLILGQACFNRSSLLIKNGGFNRFIGEIQTKKLNLIYIRDEAHRGTGVKIDREVLKAEKVLERNTLFILKMTATLKKEQINNPENKIIRMWEREVNSESEYLIKDQIQTQFDDENSQKENHFNIFWADYLDLCIQQFKFIKWQYRSNQKTKHIKPAMLLQVDSKPSAPEKSLQFENDLKTIKNKLHQQGLKWAIWFGSNKSSCFNQKINLTALSRNNSPFDVFIIKIGPGTGWDIPRACMLVQLRNVTSQILNRQTIGRIRRNPLSTLEKDPVITKYYVYSNRIPSTRYIVYQWKKSLPRTQHYYVGLVKGYNPNFNLLTLGKQKKYIQDFLDLWKQSQDQFECFLDECFKKDKKLNLKSKTKKYRSGHKVTTGCINNQLELITWKRSEYIKQKLYLEPIKKVINQKISWKNKNLVWYFVIEELLTQLKEIYQKLWSEKVLTFKLERKELVLPTEYVIWDLNNKIGFDFKNPKLKQKFAYEIINYNLPVGSKPRDFYFDSEAEKNYFSQLEQIDNFDQWHYFFKNPVTKNAISLEYLNFSNANNLFQGVKHHQYPDFIFKFIDGDLLYVEIKNIINGDGYLCKQSVKHININWGEYNNKTDRISEAYNKYQNDNPNLKKINLILERDQNFESIKIIKTLKA